MIWICPVSSHPRLSFKFEIISKLDTIVSRESMPYMLWQSFKSLHRPCLHDLTGDNIKLFSKSKSTFSFGACEYALSLFFAHNGIILEVSDSRSFVHNIRSLRDIPCFEPLIEPHAGNGASLFPVRALLS